MAKRFHIPRRTKENHVYTKDELYREYCPIFIKCLRMAKHQIMDAEDIAHDCFVKILARWDKTDWTNLEQYLSWMLNNCVVNYYNKFGADDNKKSGSELIELIDCGFVKDPFDSLLKQDFRKVLQKSMATLSESERRVFFGFYLEGKKVEELREGRQKGTILSLLFRARNKVSEYFAVYYPGGIH